MSRAGMRPLLLWLIFMLTAGAAHATPLIEVLTLQDSVDPVPATGELTYSVQVSNVSPSTSATGVGLSVALPAGTTFVSTNNASCSHSSGTVTCSFGTFAAEHDVLLDIVTRVTAPGGTTLTAVATATADGETPSVLEQETTVMDGADLALSMGATPDPVAAGGNVTYTLSVQNFGPDASSNLQIVDTLPPNMSYVSSSGAGWSCSPAGSTVTCNRSGAVANGASSVLTIVGRVQSSLNGTITNSATLSAGTADGVPNNNTDTAPVNVIAGADLSLTKLASPTPMISAAPATFTLQPRNAGPDPAASVTVVDTLPTGFTSIVASGTNWSCSVDQPTRLVTCTRASMPVGASNDITITAFAPDDTVVPPGGMTTSNTANVTGSTSDPDNGNNDGTVNITIQRDGADMSIQKSKSPNPVAAGSPLTSVMRATNNGPRALDADDTITITDTLAAGETYAGASPFTDNGWNCTYSAPAFTCTRLGPLAVGQTTPQLTLITTAAAPTSLTNTACVAIAGSQTDPNNTNNCVSANSSSTAAHGDLRITKAQNLSTVTTTDTSITYTLTIANDGPQDSTNVVVRDVIPMRTTVVAGTPTIINASAGVGSKGSTGSCSVAAQVVTCDYPTLLFQSAGTGAPNTPETAVITITVARPMADGAFTNTATVNSTNVGDPDHADNTSSVNTTVDPVADVRVEAKTVTPSAVEAGVNATYVITFSNRGPSTAQNVTLTDQFNLAGGDAGYDVMSITTTKGTCNPHDAVTRRITCNIGTLAANEAQTVEVVVRPIWMASPPMGRNLPNTATIASTTFDTDASNDSQNATLNITAAEVDLISNVSDVSSFAGVTPDPMAYDGGAPATNLITYRVSVSNLGPSEATSVDFVNTFTPPGGRQVTFVCDSTDPLSCAGTPICSNVTAGTVIGTAQQVTCAVGDMEAGSSFTRYLRYRVETAPGPTGDTYQNAVTVSSNESETNLGNNNAQEPTAVRAKADLQVSSKAALISSPPLQYGQEFQWRIIVANNGPGTAYQTTLTDTLPAHMLLTAPFTAVVTPSGSCSNTGSTQFSCNLGDIPAGAGQERTITVNVRIDRPASPPYPTTYNNTASVTTTYSVDPVSSNNSNTGSVSLVKSSIAGTVYRDNDNDGVLDAGEGGIAGVTLSLAGQDVFGNAVTRNATTDASGNYIFDNLEQSNGTGYTITQSQPTGYSDGLETAGVGTGANPPGGVVSAALNSQTISNIVLDKDQIASAYNFGELRLNSLAGRVFADIDNDGVFDGGANNDRGLQGVEITLSGTDVRGGSVNLVINTNVTGNYTFSNVLPGSYQIVETQPTLYLDGVHTAGTPAGDISVNDQVSLNVTDQDGTNYNFGERPGTISGRVWRDADRDGVLDAGELGINNVTVTLTATDAINGSFSMVTTTNATGNYSFNTVPAGTFTITETQPAGFGSTTPNSIAGVTIPAGGSSTDHNFGDSTSAVRGTVFFDRDGNGTNGGSDTGIAGVTLALTGTNAAGTAVNLSTITGADGTFSFDDLLAPNATGYTLAQTQPAEFANGQITAGSAAGTVNQGANRVTAISLASGTVATNYQFAELGTPISGVVYRDASRNGVKEASEPGIENVTIRLRDAGNTVIATTTTAANGTYSFAPQPGGSYTVEQDQPAGFSSGPENASNSVALALVAGTPGVVDFGESTGSLAGVVFIDVNEDGVQDAEDVGVPGVTLTLTGTDAQGGAVNTNVVTNASGRYVFNDLLSGTYTITETQPASLGDGLEALGAGNVGGTVGNDVYSAIALPIGAQATGYNFGESGSAVTGVVFRDFNRDGVLQAGDTAIENVTITLRDGSNNVVATATTAADGSYMIAGIPAGNYTVVETQPAGYGSSATSPDTVAVVVPTNGVATASFADTLSTLAGAVYIDLNSNGSRDAGEAGIASVTVTLTGTDASGASVNRSVGTDATGAFVFIDLLTPTGAGYTVTQPTQPSAFADGLDTAGTAGGSVANDVVTGINLAVNTDATGYLFGEGASTIGGVVFKDVNANGTRDGGDTPIAGVVIVARDISNTVVATTTTDASGTYTFVGLPAGNYTIEETQPAGYGSSTPDTVSVTVNVGSSASADFGETTSSIAGFVWTDTNNNGARDAGEPPITGVAIALSGTDAAGASISLAAMTDATGAFQFVDLLSGTYSLSETQPAAYADGIDIAGTAGGTVGNDVISAVALPAGTNATGYAFAEMGQAVVGRVWRDSDRDGALGSSEVGISAVTITLRSGGSIVATTTTDADGNYSFVNIPAGQYTVEETQPAGYGSSTPDSVNVELVAGAVAPAVNFGDTVGSIAGRVYNDANNNGSIDAGEPGIAEVSIQLNGLDARGNNVVLNATTDRDGRYRFADVAGGTYVLTETQPTGYQDGTNTAGTAGGTVGGDAISAIALGTQVDATDYLFGERGDSASIVGHVWRDADHDRVRESGETVLANWIVELYQGTLLVQSVRTNADGAYELSNVTSGSGYEIRFREPTSNSVYGKAVTNEAGLDATPGVVSASNPGGADPRSGTLLGIILPPGSQLIEQSLPLDPMGVVYDSVSRQPIAGATVTLTGPSGFDPAVHLLGGATNITQVTGEDGFYQFLLLTGAPAGDYSIGVTPPAGRYMPGPSTMIPVCPGVLQVGALPDPALVQSSVSAPAIGIGNVQSCPSSSAGLAAGVDTTQYFFAFNLTPGSSADVINNHVPVDPILQGAIVVTKTTPMVNVTRGDLVPYTITATNMLNATLTNVDVRDLLPPGFAYRNGTASLNGAMLEPERVGRQLTWRSQTFAPSETKTFKLVLVVGSGVSEGEYVNQAFALNNLIDPSLADPTLSNVATAAVRIVPDPVFDCSDLIGKVFDDRNANGYQDEGEPGLPNVRVVTLNGIIVTADADGRFHVACAAIPNEYRGSNFVMKLDERTLPSGYRVTTENPRDVRLTRGKLTKLNFGATIHRVVRVEVTDEAFEPGTTTLRAEWRERLSALPKTLADKPSVVRIAYAGDEDAKLVKRRKQTLIRQIREQWEALHREYPLHVEDETEVQP